MRLEEIERATLPLGLAPVGAFAAKPEHDAPGGVGAIVLLGMARDGWAAFGSSPEFADAAPDPLDRWSERVVSGLAEALQGQPLFPFGGPPWRPFLRWAAASGEVWTSPLGMSIHAERGLWISYRGALGLARLDGLNSDEQKQSPCESCTDRPCLDACPVGAFDGVGYDIMACVAHIAGQAGNDCMGQGCRARRACPIGREWIPEHARAAFHMRAFRAARQS